MKNRITGVALLFDISTSVVRTHGLARTQIHWT
jgi:hypothetical protein